MFKKQLKDQFDAMLPYLKDKCKPLIDDILRRADDIDNKGVKANVNEIQNIIRDADKVLSIDQKLKDLFSNI